MYYCAVSMVFCLFSIIKLQIYKGRLDSIRNQILQGMGKGYNRKLNGKSKQSTRYSISRFCGATTYVRTLVPYFKDDLKIDKNWEGNGKNVNVDLSNANIASILKKWSTNTVVGDSEKGERDVKYWGRRHSLHYSFRTNMISLKFSVVRRVLPLKK